MKLICDRCGKELDSKGMNYVGMSINDYADSNSDLECWEFCHDCMSSIKHSILTNISRYENEGKG